LTVGSFATQGKMDGQQIGKDILTKLMELGIEIAEKSMRK